MVMGLCSVAGLYFYIKPDLPSVSVLKDVRLQTPMKVFTQDGKLISQFGVKRRIPLGLDDVPQTLIHAILATEDSRFFEHPGIDPIGILRAAFNLVLTGEKGQGGSTLTMQLARGFFLTREKTFLRKFKEIFIAWHIERVLTKEEILALYINKVELGHRSFGFGAAAQVYYGKDIKELTLAQIATLAGLPKAPSTMNPISRPERSLMRRKVVLSRMKTEGYITDEQYMVAANAAVTAEKHGAEIELDAPYLANVIYEEMISLYGKEEAETGGYNVYATVPSHLQLAARNAVVQNLHDYDERHGYRGPVATLWNQEEDVPWTEQDMLDYLSPVPSYKPLEPAIVTQVYEKAITVLSKSGEYHYIDWDGLAWARPFLSDTKQGPEPEVAADVAKIGEHVWIRRMQDADVWQLSQFPDASGALVALDPNNGAVRAIVGGYSFYQSQFNRATQAKRQVGSNIKPFLYSAALENGYTLSSIINDAPINQWDRGSGNAWRPKNSPAIYDGPIRMRIALGKSKNVVSVRLLRAVGIDNVRQYMRQFGFDLSDLPRDESLSLGTASLAPIEVVTGFATFANGGYAVTPHFIERIEGQFGEYVWQASPPTACPACALSDGSIAQVSPDTSMLKESVQSAAQLPPQAQRIISEQNAFLVAEMMRTAITGSGSTRNKTYWRGTGWRANTLLRRKDIAGKTGTTNDAKDTWFSGFSPKLVATAWVGFDDMSRSLGRTSRNKYLFNQVRKQTGRSPNIIGNAMVGGEDGARVAQPAWIRFMEKALQDYPEVNKHIPEDIVTVRIDRTTGKLTDRVDHTSRFEYFMSGTEPQTYVDEREIVDPVGDNEAEPAPTDEIF
ncbi:penicillin-binding protein 1A [Alteromonas sp. a30]|nr:penicillin-binding protein 1A [Alteromonas sp. a30]